MPFEIGLDLLQELHPHVGGLQHDVEAAAGEDARKGSLVVERPARVGAVADEAVADHDRRLERRELVLAPCRLEPQGQPRDLDRFRVEVDAVEIARENFVERVEVDGFARSARRASVRRYSAASELNAATRNAPAPQAGSKTVTPWSAAR